MNNGLGNSHPLLVALGKLADEFMFYLFQPTAFHGGLRCLLEIGFFDVTQLAAVVQVFADFQLLIKRRLFRQITDLLFGFCRLFQQVIAIDGDLPLMRGQYATKHFHGGGFACTIGAKQPQNITLF